MELHVEAKEWMDYYISAIIVDVIIYPVLNWIDLSYENRSLGSNFLAFVFRIILDSAHDLYDRTFFNNLGTILLHAVLVSSAIVKHLIVLLYFHMHGTCRF